MCMAWIEYEMGNVNLFCPQEFRGPKYIPAYEWLALLRVITLREYFHIVWPLKENQLLLMLNHRNAGRKSSYVEVTETEYADLQYTRF